VLCRGRVIRFAMRAKPPTTWHLIQSTGGRYNYGVELASTVIMRICVVPDYQRGEPNFLINDLAYLASEEFLPVLPAAGVS
jgi:hypothetical protein